MPKASTTCGNNAGLCSKAVPPSPPPAERPLRILISSGEASGDLYAAALVSALRERLGEVDFFGCTGPRMRAAGVRTVVDSSSLAVVGLVEVLAHIPRIYGEFRKLLGAARLDRPDLAILTDSPDFHLRVAKKLVPMGVPVVYLIAPQVWAWRKDRLPMMRRVISHLLCIFPFEQQFFRDAGITATYIGHPLARLVKPSWTREEWMQRHGLDPAKPLVTLLPGSRVGEVGRHLQTVVDAAVQIRRDSGAQVVMASPAGLRERAPANFWEPLSAASIQLIEGETWDAIAHATVALAASGTVTVETALLGTPMVTYYRVTTLSWLLGKMLVKVPFYTMVNLVAERRIVPELMQQDMTPGTLAQETLRLLNDGEARQQMRLDLQELRQRLATGDDPMERAASIVEETLRQRKREG